MIPIPNSCVICENCILALPLSSVFDANEVMGDIRKEDFPKLGPVGSNCSDVQKAKATVYMWRHLSQYFKDELFVERDPFAIWQHLKEHFDLLKSAELIQAKYDWDHLSFSDFDSVTEYDSALQDIVDQFKACDKEMTEKELIEKTLFTFPPSDYILRRMHMKNNYGTYAELISELLLEEKQYQELLKNYYARPTRRKTYMSRVVGPDFPRLRPFGLRRNYFTWASNIENYLAQNNLSDTIVSGSNCSEQQKVQVLWYMRRHLNQDFKNEFMLEQDPLVLWQALKDHFGRMKAVELPQAIADWERLYFGDFDSVAAYDSALRRIVCQLKLCDKEVTDGQMIEKTLSTFLPSQLVRHRMHRAAKYGTYSELIFALLQEEKGNQELMRDNCTRSAQKASFKRKGRRGQSGKV
ncbi:hypothetical protein U9M48_015433 [Paspalum notatum var. saurae]|uniref:Uncharacterized protein n=1 Tax=Paspalum notatum var. saurae TaxID=547442 RepID=A0AAQ3WM21_PASNO